MCFPLSWIIRLEVWELSLYANVIIYISAVQNLPRPNFQQGNVSLPHLAPASLSKFTPDAHHPSYFVLSPGFTGIPPKMSPTILSSYLSINTY